MKFVLACYGTRGDVEPGAAIGRELLRRGHEVCMAVPPDLIGFVESAGLPAVAYGMDTRPWLDVHHDFWARLLGNFWKIHDVVRLWREVWEPVIQCWDETSKTLTSLSEGADLVLTGPVFEELAGNVAEHYDIPLATYHYTPTRVNGQLLPSLPAPLVRLAMTGYQRVAWLLTRKLENAQRRELGLRSSATPSPRRITRRGSLEIQAYDEVCFPGLAAEWAKFGAQRPFVGALTLELSTDVDEEVASWIAAGTPPIYFGFGSIPVGSAADTLTMISDACAQLGERALVCCGGTDFSQVVHADHLKIVRAVNHGAVFPVCRAVVHHGGSGTTAAGLRAGVPALILPVLGDQPYWGMVVKRLKVGTARRFSTTTRETLVEDLRAILGPQYATRAREVATQVTKPADSVAAAADVVENFARQRCISPGRGESRK